MVLDRFSWPQPKSPEEWNPEPVVGERTLEKSKTESFYSETEKAKVSTKRRRSPDARADRVEDNLLMFPEIDLYAVFDGVGRSDGAEASKRAAERLKEKIEAMQESMDNDVQDLSVEDLAVFLKIIIKDVNSDLSLRNQNKDVDSKMYTTLTLVSFVGNKMIMAAIGDSPGYFYSEDSGFEKVTVDSDVVREDYQMRKGFPSAINELDSTGVDQIPSLREAQKSKPAILGNKLTHFLGREASPRELRAFPVDIYVREVKQGDKIFITSDGVPKEVTDEALEKIIAENQDVDILGETIMDSACQKEGSDYSDDKVFSLIEVK